MSPVRMPALLLGLTLLLAGCDDSPPDGAPAPTGSAPTGSSPVTVPPPHHSPGDTPTPTPTQTPTRTPSTPAAPQSCTALAGSLPIRTKAAQLVMSGVRADDMTGGQRSALTGQQPGGILLIGHGGAEAAGVIDDATEAAGSPAGIRPLVAADQEGGKVQRLRGGPFDTIPSATEQGSWTAATLTRRAAGWGRQLRRAGVTADLAPVADVVPPEVGDSNEPVGALDRNFGSRPGPVGEHVAAFVRGMRSARVATAVKHFPGLGRVRGNTDFSTGVVDRVTTRSDPLLAPFGAGIRAGADLVMVSTATYTRIDPDRRAAFSPVVIRGMIRGDLGFGGVVIADDLGQAKEVASVPPGERAVRFARAGGDIAITADASLVEPMVDALVAEAGRDAAFRVGLDASVRRVIALKQRYGLVSCR